MAWTTKIVSSQKSAGKVTVRVAFSNGTETFEEEYATGSKINMEWLKAQLRSRVEAMTESYAFADALSKDQVIDLTVPAVVVPVEPAPSAAELERDAFLSDYHRFLAIKRGIDAGIVDAEEPKVAELVNKLKAAFKPAYLKHI